MMTSKADTPINAENGGVITKKDLVRMFWRSLLLKRFIKMILKD